MCDNNQHHLCANVDSHDSSNRSNFVEISIWLLHDRAFHYYTYRYLLVLIVYFSSSLLIIYNNIVEGIRYLSKVKLSLLELFVFFLELNRTAENRKFIQKHIDIDKWKYFLSTFSSRTLFNDHLPNIILLHMF